MEHIVNSFKWSLLFDPKFPEDLVPMGRDVDGSDLYAIQGIFENGKHQGKKNMNIENGLVPYDGFEVNHYFNLI